MSKNRQILVVQAEIAKYAIKTCILHRIVAFLHVVRKVTIFGGGLYYGFLGVLPQKKSNGFFGLVWVVANVGIHIHSFLYKNGTRKPGLS